MFVNDIEIDDSYMTGASSNEMFYPNDRQLKLLDRIYNTYECEVGLLYDKADRYEIYAEDLKLMDRHGYIQLVNINIGIRGGNIKLIQTTNKGRDMVDTWLSEREMDAVLKQHTSLQHGYLIKHICSLYKNLGYNVLTSHEETRYTINKKAIEPDLIVELKNIKHYVEVECGTTDYYNMKKKMDKYNMAELDVIFICPNSKALDSTRRKVEDWESEAESIISIDYINISLPKLLKTKMMQIRRGRK